MSTTFIYALCEPGTRTVRYIGKSNSPVRRAKGHFSRSCKYSSHLGSWLRKLRAEDKKPNLIVLREVSVLEWKTAEERFIRLARGCGMDLVNATDGGDGGAAFNTGKNHPQFGKVGASCHNYGRKHSRESRENMSKAHLGLKHSLESRKKSSESVRKSWDLRRRGK